MSVGPEGAKPKTPESGEPSLTKRLDELEAWRTGIRDDLPQIRESIARVREDMLQTVSVFVGILGIIFAIVIGAAFQTGSSFKADAAVTYLLAFLSGVTVLWFGLWLFRNRANL